MLNVNLSAYGEPVIVTVPEVPAKMAEVLVREGGHATLLVPFHQFCVELFQFPEPPVPLTPHVKSLSALGMKLANAHAVAARSFLIVGLRLKKRATVPSPALTGKR